MRSASLAAEHPDNTLAELEARLAKKKGTVGHAINLNIVWVTRRLRNCL
jgi:hypothetical protein